MTDPRESRTDRRDPRLVALAEESGYEILGRIGAGGMGIVYRGLDADGNDVAIKLLRHEISDDPHARGRLGREVAAQQRVRNDNIARILDAELDSGDAFVVTEFVPGPTLEDAVHEHGGLHPEAVREIGLVMGHALRDIHASGVVHRDLKPSNVLLRGATEEDLLGFDPEGDGLDPVIIDFGIAIAAEESRLTSTGLVMGTAAYLDPEVVRTNHTGEVADWWAWAAMLAFTATGREPFGKGRADLVFLRAERGEIDIDGVPAELAEWLRSALRSDPAERADPGALLARLADLDLTHYEDPGPTEVFEAGSRTAALPVTGAAAGAGAAGGAGGVAAAGATTPTEPPDESPNEARSATEPATESLPAAEPPTEAIEPVQQPGQEAATEALPTVGPATKPLPAVPADPHPPAGAPAPPPAQAAPHPVQRRDAARPYPPQGPPHYAPSPQQQAPSPQQAPLQQAPGHPPPGQAPQQAPQWPQGYPVAEAGPMMPHGAWPTPPPPRRPLLVWLGHLLIVAVAAVAPYVSLTLLLLLGALARTWERSHRAVAGRRLRGSVGSGPLWGAAFASPFRFLLGVLEIALQALLPLILGLLVGVALDASLTLIRGAAPPDGLAFAAAMAVTLLITWVGLGSRTTRGGAHRMVDAAAPDAVWTAVLLVLLALLVAAVVITLLAREGMVDYFPLPDGPRLDDIALWRQ